MVSSESDHSESLNNQIQSREAEPKEVHVYHSMSFTCMSSLPASSKFGCLLLIFANGLDPDQA